jgi:hypothetical protein
MTSKKFIYILMSILFVTCLQHDKDNARLQPDDVPEIHAEEETIDEEQDDEETVDEDEGILCGIRITGEPVKKNYKMGEELDTADLAVENVYHMGF